MVNRPRNLSDRASVLLRALTGQYIESGEPVSSIVLSNLLALSGQHVPPSTIRMELGRLEQDGYLVKTHSSSGRVPTAQAYRHYVDMLEPASIQTPLDREIMEACRALSGELGRLLDYTSELLANESGCLGFVTSPNLNDARISGLKLDRLEENTVLLRLELQSGRVYHHLARLPGAVGSLRLHDLSEFLSERIRGRRLGDVTEAEIAAIINHAAEWGRGYEIFVHPLHDLITDARLGESPRTVIYGAAGLLKASGDDAESLARAVALLDNRRKFERTLNSVPGGDEVVVLIGGAENLDRTHRDNILTIDPVLDGFALVVANYHLHQRSHGRLGVLGPLRMPYSEHLSLVKSVSDLISRLLISRELGLHSA